MTMVSFPAFHRLALALGFPCGDPLFDRLELGVGRLLRKYFGGRKISRILDDNHNLLLVQQQWLNF